MSTLQELSRWYGAQCNGDWEHSFGVHIGTLDNLGWVVKINVYDTRLEEWPFVPVSRGDPGDENDADTWIDCKVENHVFVGMGGPSQLEPILETFLAWAKSLPDWLEPPGDAEAAAREDRRFWAALGEEVGPEGCGHTGCERRRIRQSVLRRAHHFIQMKGRPFGGM